MTFSVSLHPLELTSLILFLTPVLLSGGSCADDFTTQALMVA